MEKKQKTFKNPTEKKQTARKRKNYTSAICVRCNSWFTTFDPEPMLICDPCFEDLVAE